MRKIIATIILFASFFAANTAHATHEVIADISYRCLGGNQYEVKLEIYRHCAGIPATSSEIVSYQSAACGSSGSLTLNFVNSVEVSPVCPFNLPLTDCNGGPISGYWKDQFLDTVTLTQSCADWVFTHTTCCMGGATNISNTNTLSLVGQASLDNQNAACNNSVQLNGESLNYTTTNQPFVLDPRATDADGDDLLFRLVALKGGTPTYAAGYSAQTPIINMQSFNTSTGRIEFTPTTQGLFYVTYEVDELRNGVVIATSYRSYFVVVANGTGSTLPTCNLTNIQGAAQLGDTLVIHLGDTVDFDVVFTDADVNDSILIMENLATELPGASFVITGINPATISINWVANTAGAFPIGLVYENAACPYPQSQQLKEIILYVDTNCVWAGDANYDYITNHFDLLPLGLGFGQTGPLRPNAGIDYDCEPMVDWGVSTPVSNVDYKHSDTNGDGVVDANDVAAIIQNWGLTHPRPGAGQVSANAVPMYVSSTTTVPSAMISLPVILGDTTNPVDSAYGIAFTINYDESLVKSNSVYMTFGNSWLGTENVDMITVQKDFYNNGQLQVAMTRTDQLPVTGSGSIGTLHLTIKDVIIKSLDRRLNFSISNVRFISQEEVDLAVNTINSDVLIETGTAVTTIESVPLSIAPNPASDFVQVQTKGQAMTSLNLYNTQGQLLRSFQPNNSQFRLEVAELPAGLYLLEVATAAGRSTHKLLLK